jgi:hypothetical protein
VEQKLITTNRKFKVSLPILLILLAVLFSFAINTASAVPSQLYVSNTGNDAWSGQSPTWNGTDGPKQTIKSATTIVTNDGTIHIANGTYNENDISVFSKNVNYVGESKTKTIVNGNQISRLFTIGAQGVTYSFSFTNMSFINGKSSAGGAIWNYGSTTINNCIFRNNNASASGGAIYSFGTGSAPASLFISKCSFINNTCPNGILLNALSTLSVTGSNFENNTGTTRSILWNNFGTISQFQFNRIIGTGTLITSDYGGDLSLNWWGSNSNPSAMVTGVTVDPWLVLTVLANPTAVVTNGSSTVTADLQHDSNGVYYDPSIYGSVPDGIVVNFATGALGTVNPLIGSMINGEASTTFKAGQTLGVAAITAAADAATGTANVNIITGSPPTVTTTDPVNNAVNVALNKVVKFNFNKAILLAANPWIEFYTGTTPVAFTATVSGSTLSLTPNALLTSGQLYNVIIHSNAVTSLTGVGLAAPYGLKFTTDTAPTVTTTDPVNNAVNVPLNKVVKFNFNKAIKMGTSPWIEFKTAGGTAKAFTTSITGNTLNITPTTPLATKTQYIVAVHSNAVTSTGGAGLALPYVIKFNTV